METKRIKISDTKNINDEELKEAAQILRDGGLVAFPTETVYGLGGNALDEKAAGKIYAAKGRPSDNPLIAHVSCAAEVTPLVKYIPEAGKKLMDAFWVKCMNKLSLILWCFLIFDVSTSCLIIFKV